VCDGPCLPSPFVCPESDLLQEFGNPLRQRDREAQMVAAQQGREAEAASRKQEEVNMTARVAAETLRRMEVRLSIK